MARFPFTSGARVERISDLRRGTVTRVIDTEGALGGLVEVRWDGQRRASRSAGFEPVDGLRLWTPSGSDISEVLRTLGAVEREAREARDFRRSQAAYGLGWAIETGRAPMEAVAAVVTDPHGLIDRAAVECDTIGDVPGWLIRTAA